MVTHKRSQFVVGEIKDEIWIMEYSLALQETGKMNVRFFELIVNLHGNRLPSLSLAHGLSSSRNDPL
jgi:hypothetical protein